MFPAAPMESVTPKVKLVWMTQDPLGVIAAVCKMYEGQPVSHLSEITDNDRWHYWDQVQKTHLKAPLEFVKLHFELEGVTRAFTHQHVRQRTAVYAQESLRFAVKEDLASEVRYPPSLMDVGLSHSERNIRRDVWDIAIDQIQKGYQALIANGVPAEDARGLLPHATTTRLHYCTDLRNLIDHAGNRLCTQAQYEWKEVFMGQEGIIQAIRNYTPDWSWCNDLPQYGYDSNIGVRNVVDMWNEQFRWQHHQITDDVFTPVCYQMNRCPFQADFDRGCTIRDRVLEFTHYGIGSEHWAGDSEGICTAQDGSPLQGIDRAEWLADPKAGWVE